MRDVLSSLGNGLSDIAGLAGRGFWGAATLGATEIARANQRAEQAKQAQDLAAIGNVLSGQATPQFMRPGMTTESLTPEAYDTEKARQLFQLGSPEAAKIATQFIATPENRLQKANVESQIANRDATLGLQREELALSKADKERSYALAAKELEAKLKMGADPKEIFDRESKLRNEFVTQSKDFVTQRDAYDKVVIAAQDPSAAGDISLIYGFMKLNDPTSSVKEGEYATAQNAGSIPERVRSQYNKALSGQRLDPNVRNDFVDRSKRLFEGSKRQHDKRVGQYTKLAERSGANPEQVIIDLGLVEKAPTASTGWSVKPLGGK